jgi:hypothetical protein
MPSWMQVSGQHGSLISLWDISFSADSKTLYYRDDSSHQDAPESDDGEWGDFGIYGDTLSRPQQISTDLYLYPLPALSTNMGNTYQSYKDNPLQVASAAQSVPAAPPSNFTIDISGSNIHLTWTDNPNADHYTIFRSTFADDQGTPMANISQGIQEWNDTNAVGDGNDYYYTIVSVSSSGTISNHSYRLMKHDQALTSGLNIISLTVHLNNPITSHSLLDGTNAIPGATEVSRWNSSSGQWDSAKLIGSSVHGPDFTLELGAGYSIKVSQNTVWTTAGRLIDSPVTLHLTAGLNLISIPYSSTDYTSHSLLDGTNAIPGATEVSRWNSSSGQWDSAKLIGSSVHGPDFTINPGEAYFIKVSSDIDWTPSSSSSGQQPDNTQTPNSSPIYDEVSTNSRAEHPTAINTSNQTEFSEEKY